ncbi:hypothetical protein [Deinococcus sp.]|uniref:hypothetical protein n=1 Tax=Deinococcus sp. TaxID=47478 RepID=UPI003B58C240
MNSGGSSWGGKRERAGRKPSPNLRVSLSVPREVWAELERLARQKNITAEQLAAVWLVERSAQIADAHE